MIRFYTKFCEIISFLSIFMHFYQFFSNKFVFFIKESQIWLLCLSWIFFLIVFQIRLSISRFRLRRNPYKTWREPLISLFQCILAGKFCCWKGEFTWLPNKLKVVGIQLEPWFGQRVRFEKRVEKKKEGWVK